MLFNVSKSKIESYILKIKSDNIWDITNQTLYDLCEKYPSHTNPGEIVAKVIIIGRVYAAALERGKATEHAKGDEFYRTAVPDAMTQAFNLPEANNLATKLKSNPDFKDAIRLHEIINSHLKPLRGINKVSFTSKYLHFHFPNAYYIFDSRANIGLPILEKMFEEKFIRDQYFKNTTPYGKFYCRAEFIRNHLKKLMGEHLTHREFDSLLLHISSIV